MAIPYADVPGLMPEIPATIPGQALQFAILSAARTSEVRFAVWGEFDLPAKLWTIPAARTKQGRPHLVPLSGPAIALLERVPRIVSGPGWVFSGVHQDKPINADAMRRVLQRLRPGFTVHGFRSCFSDWAAEKTNSPRLVVEMSLGHTVGGATELAYRRTDLLDRRRKLMGAWSSYCMPAKTARVVSIRS